MNSFRRELIFRVFVSSTFQDMKAERNALQENVFPKLREYCRERNASFQAVDLRWGVSEEASYDHRTMSICMRELERCQQVSPRPNFIILLGQRYGWVPLPTSIPADDEFKKLLPFISEADRPVLMKWYCLDKNADPSEYTLLPRENEFKKRAIWGQVEDQLRKILQCAAMKALTKSDPRRKKYFESATHQEINHGALSPSLDVEGHVFAYFRKITGVLPSKSTAGYIDTGIEAEKLNGLRKQLHKHLPQEHIYSYEAELAVDGPKVDLEFLCERVRKDLECIIDEETMRVQTLSAINFERDSHSEFGLERCQHFVGRDDVLGQIKLYLASDLNTPIIIHGPSGIGKTALMAEAWRKLSTPDQSIIRFIGATPASVDLRMLLRSLCMELDIKTIPSAIDELGVVFKERLSGGIEGNVEPIVVFLDALDQLNETEETRLLNWLPRQLAPGVKIVLSVLDDKNPLECFSVASHLWPEALVLLGPLGAVEGNSILKIWLTDIGRSLQYEQRRDVLSKFTRDGSPLYLKLAFEQTRRWKSWAAVDLSTSDRLGISPTVEGLLEDLFVNLEQEYGKTLVASALGYIATAKNGLTEEELMGLLSQDVAVMKNFIRHSLTEREKPPKDRLKELPIIVWSRLYADIEYYMKYRRIDGTQVINFFHRQVGAAVRTKYLDGEQALLLKHKNLADYFDNFSYWAESLKAQQTRAKRLPPTPRPVNVRKVVELPYHRLEAAKIGGNNDPKSEFWDAVVRLLTDWQFLEAKAEADPYINEAKTVELWTGDGEVQQ